MALTIEKVFTDAISLPEQKRAVLIKKLIASMENMTDPDILAWQLLTAKRRRDEVRSGQVQSLPVDKVLADIRRTVLS